MKTFAASNDEKLANYLEATFHPEDETLRQVVESSKKAGLPEIQVGDMDGLHLEVLARAIGAKKIVEIGTLGGYSGVHLARALPKDGKLYTFEMSPAHAEVARKSFELAGASSKVEILVGPALANLSKITQHGPFDLVFIDADKVSYPKYLEWAAENLRVGGAVLGDNTFAWGMIADEKFEDASDEAAVRALREFNDRVANSGRFKGTILPTGEGLTLGVKIR
jgi:caffeoyl-CoA O-methyltransferase